MYSTSSNVLTESRLQRKNDNPKSQRDTVILFSPRWYPKFETKDHWQRIRKAEDRFRSGDNSYPQDLAYKRPLNLGVPYYCLAIASYLKKLSFKTEIIDMHLEISPRHRIEQHRGKILCVGIECERPYAYAEGSAISRALRTVLPEVPIIWFGYMPTLFAGKFCSEGVADIVVRGQPEITFMEAVKSIEKNQPTKSVESLTYLESSGKVVDNPDRPLVFEEKSPAIDYSLLPIDNYALGGGKHVVIRTSVGCASQCSFCWFPVMYGTTYAGLSAKRVVKELVFLKEKYNLKSITFADQSFIQRKRRVQEICEGIIEAKIELKWRASGQINVLYKYPDSLLKLMGEAGCSYIQMGVESGSEHLLKCLKKPHNWEMVITLAKRLKKYNIGIRANFIFGLPGETEEDFYKSWKLIRELQSIQSGLEIDYYHYTPVLGNELYERLSAEGKLKENKPEGNDIASWIKFSKEMEKPWFNDKYDRQKETYYHLFGYDDTRVARIQHPLLKAIVPIYKQYARFRAKHKFYAFAFDHYLAKTLDKFQTDRSWDMAFKMNLCKDVK